MNNEKLVKSFDAMRKALQAIVKCSHSLSVIEQGDPNEGHPSSVLAATLRKECMKKAIVREIQNIANAALRQSKGYKKEPTTITINVSIPESPTDEELDEIEQMLNQMEAIDKSHRIDQKIIISGTWDMGNKENNDEM